MIYFGYFSFSLTHLELKRQNHTLRGDTYYIPDIGEYPPGKKTVIRNRKN